MAVGSQGPPSLCNTGLRRATGGRRAHQLTCQSNQVNITEYIRRFVYSSIVFISVFFNHLSALKYIFLPPIPSGFQQMRGSAGMYITSLATPFTSAAWTVSPALAP